MKRNFFIACTLLFCCAIPMQMAGKGKVKFSAQEKVELNQMIEQALGNARNQALLMARELENQEGQLPKNVDKNGKFNTSDCFWWCSGFFPGILWMLSEDQPQNKQLRQYAELFTQRVEPVRNEKHSHDVGFMLNCSFGHAYRITGDKAYLPVLSDGARNLAARFIPKAGVTRSWEPNKKWKNPVIIDNMMNMELLELIGKMEKNQRYLDIAESHAKTTMKNHYREDYSTFHVVDYDDQTGEVLHRQTAQGYADNSAWARGQMWGLYGYSMMYRETGDKTYLKQAQQVAKYLTGRSNWPEDMVPYWDFDCPDIPNTVRDASSAAIMASALIELSTFDKKSNAKRWMETAIKQLKSLASPAYTAPAGSHHGFILLHSTGSFPANSEVDIPLTYADYYYVEALLRLKKLLNN